MYREAYFQSVLYFASKTPGFEIMEQIRRVFGDN